MSDERDWFLLVTGRKLEEVTRIPSIEEVLDEQILSYQSNYPLRPLGHSTEKNIKIREEDRSHIHLIGSTQEGKSKYIEFLCRGDIRRDIGFCLIDPTSGATTVYEVLKWCAHKKLKKVVLIDPYHRYQYKKVIGLSPFLYHADGNPSQKLKEISVNDFQDTIRNFSAITDFAQTMSIERYLPSVLNALYDAKRPLSDAKYFGSKLYKAQRQEILECTDDDTQVDITEAFNTPAAYKDFQSTIRRMQRFFKGTLGEMFSQTTNLNFMKLISEGWIILVNLDSGLGFTPLDARLLGTLIINQIQVAIERLLAKKREKNINASGKRYYLYIDEASQFATRKLATTLSLKQKTGLRVTLAHQYRDQFEDKFIHSAIMANCKITAMFNITMAEDRDYISKQFYGGQILPADASDANSDLAKQYAVIKALKGSPRRIRVADVYPPEDIGADELKNYIKQIYQQPWYHDVNDGQTTTNTRPAKPGAKANGKTGRKPRLPDDGDRRQKWATVSEDLQRGK